MNEQPLVSVVIPCYNHAGYVKESIESVLGQSYKNFELIVVNDGSTDNSLEVIEALSNQHGFRVISQSNAGLTAAIDTGLKASSGKYFVSFDSDDIMLPDRLALQVQHMEASPGVGCCGANFEYISADGRRVGGAPRRTKAIYKFRDVFENPHVWVGAGTSMYRSAAIDQAGGFDLDISIQDFQMELKVTYIGYDISFIEDVVSLYRRHDENMSSNYKKNFYVYLKTLERYKDEKGYLKAKRNIVHGALKKAVVEDKDFAKELFRMLPIRAWNIKTFRRLKYYIFK